jgi:hypothetical protein
MGLTARQWGSQPDAGVAFELSTPNGGDLSADNGGHGQRGRRRTSECGQWGLQPDAGVAFELSTPNGGDDPFALHAMRLKSLCLKNIYEKTHEHLLHEMFQNKRHLQRPRRHVLTVNR